jgi:aminopeptidase N
VTVAEAAHAFEFALAARPSQVIFDAGDVVLKSGKLEKSGALWRRQLEAARQGIDRVAAARALGELPDPAGVAALRTSLARDTFWGVRAAAARALGATRRADARDTLIGALGDPHPRVRRAVAGALGEFVADEVAAQALGELLRRGDPSVFVEAEAAAALGRTRSPLAVELLPALIERPSFQDVLASRAIEGLGKSGDERALPLLRTLKRPRASWAARRAVVSALAELARGTGMARAARETIELQLGDRDFRVRGEAGAALARLGLPDAIPVIRRALGGELDGRARRRMAEAARELEAGTRPAEEARHLHDEVERLRGETARLRERLERVEARLVTPPPSTPPPTPKSKRPRPVSRRARTSRPVRR